MIYSSPEKYINTFLYHIQYAGFICFRFSFHIDYLKYVCMYLLVNIKLHS